MCQTKQASKRLSAVFLLSPSRLFTAQQQAASNNKLQQATMFTGDHKKRKVVSLGGRRQQQQSASDARRARQAREVCVSCLSIRLSAPLLQCSYILALMSSNHVFCTLDPARAEAAGGCSLPPALVVPDSFYPRNCMSALQERVCECVSVRASTPTPTVTRNAADATHRFSYPPSFSPFVRMRTAMNKQRSVLWQELDALLDTAATDAGCQAPSLQRMVTLVVVLLFANSRPRNTAHLRHKHTVVSINGSQQ